MQSDEKTDLGNHPEGRVKYFFFLDGNKFESATSSITGADVRAKLPPDKAGYAIYLEEHGNDPDKQVADADTFSLEKTPLHFYSVPPANFGGA
jgi:hypothetical protein